MKTRNGFVSNSSSSSFVITNKTNEHKTIYDFAEETKHLAKEFSEEYGYPNINEESYICSAKNYDNEWKPNEIAVCMFGDEFGDDLGHVCDYMLRNSGETKSFSWEFVECRGTIENEKLYKKYFKKTWDIVKEN